MNPAFDGIIDYAGLFPPASLTMDEAMREYGLCRAGPDRAMVARFVIAARSLHELTNATVRTKIRPPAFDPWPLSVVFGDNHVEDLERIAALEATSFGDNFKVRAAEARIKTVGEVSVVTERFNAHWEVFLELPHHSDFDALMPALFDARAAAKFRTGGTSPELFPSAAELARFVFAANAHGVPFKATAGLHHLKTGDYPLTYAPNSPKHRMFGWFNLTFAAAAVYRGADVETAEAMLAEANPDAFRRGHGYFQWREWQIDYEDIAASRIDGFRGFGSCSFSEPVNELVYEVGR